MRISSWQLSSGLLALQGVIVSTWARPHESVEMAAGAVKPAVVHPRSTCADVISWAPTRQEPAIVLQVVSKSFVYVEQNFLMLMESRSSITRNNLYLMCLDDEALAAMEYLQVPCVPVAGVRSLRQLWNLRVHTLGCLLEAGWDVLLSDSDALWLFDPIANMKLEGLENADIVTQRGSYPALQNDEWGVTMCMGFAFFRARRSVGMALYQKAMRENVVSSGDDQVALNVAAYDLGVVWDSDSDMRYYDSTGIGKGVVTNLCTEDGEFTIALLPHNTYIRHCDKSPISGETVVAHCRSKKEDKDKESWMKSANLWLVNSTSSVP